MNKDTLARQVGNYILRLCYVPRTKNVYKDPKGKHHVIRQTLSTYPSDKLIHTKFGGRYMNKGDNRMRHVQNWKEFKRYYCPTNKVGKDNAKVIENAFAYIFDNNSKLRHHVE